MKYHQVDLKLDQFIQYVNDGKINLIPSFQRGHAWKLPMRMKLIANIVQGRPIPAIFLYRQASDDSESFTYNILDGKQRLESLMLYVGNRRPTLKVDAIHHYFFDKRVRKTANFPIELEIEQKTKKVNLENLPIDLFRNLKEYIIPTIEITLSEDEPSAIGEIIRLFVDINSNGVKVTRFQIVKAMCGDPLLKSTYSMIAVKQIRKGDVLNKTVSGDVNSVLKTLQVITSMKDRNAQVDRMWELLVEVVLFLRTKKHRNPVEILKSFIRAKDEQQSRVSNSERKELKSVFGFLAKAYKNPQLRKTKLATNQIHFYTMITALIAGNLLTEFSVVGPFEFRWWVRSIGNPYPTFGFAWVRFGCIFCLKDIAPFLVVFRGFVS
jgi:hypothetical protein